MFPPLEAEEIYAPQQDQDWDDNLPNLRLVYSRLRFESCPREPEMVDCHNRGQLLPLQLPTHSLPEGRSIHFPFDRPGFAHHQG
jgi:hypothetical protein